MLRTEMIARSLGGQRVGSGWMARCPAHDDHEPSLSILAAPDGKVLVCCHAGCEQAAVIAALRTRGLWGPQPLDSTTVPDLGKRSGVEPEHSQVDRSETALA